VSAVAGLLMLTAASAAPPVALECPAISGQTLVYVDIFDGPPDQQADLAPDDTKTQPGGSSNIWQLDASPAGLFVKCGYGKALAGPYSRVETIRLPDTAKSCRADFKSGKRPDDLILQKFSCR
jgi:hypothetical protein